LNEEVLAKNRRIVELGEEIQQLSGYKLYYNDLKGLEISLNTFDKNYRDLRAVIHFITTDPRGAMLHNIQNRDKLEAFGYEVICRIHNYVAAVLSLLDHTRNLYKKLYKGTDLFPEYQERIDTDFKNNPLSKFVQDLRRYFQHYKSPIIMFTTTVDSNEHFIVTISIPLDDLMVFKDWSAPAKEYLSTFQEKVDVLEIASAYRDTVIAFYNWFRSRQEEIHADELKELDDKKDELRELMGDSYIPPS
jgi:hypothetical protein